MAKHTKSLHQISDITNSIIDPILAKRAGINTMLLGIWDEVVGEEFAKISRPDKMVWPKQEHFEDGGRASPGLLVIACHGSSALFLSHQQNEIIQRINAVFGFPVIDRVKIVQKVISEPQKIKNKLPVLSKDKMKQLNQMLKDVEHPRMKAALMKLGRNVIGQK